MFYSKKTTMQYLKIQVILLLGIILFSCGTDPKVIEAESTDGGENAPLFQDPGATQSANNATAPPAGVDAAVHRVVVEEALNTEKYTYLRVKENEQEFWIAVMKQDVKIGGAYLFRGGLMKKNFQSKEYNRTFETLYLVSDFREEGAQATAQTVEQAHANVQKTSSVEPPQNIALAPGAVKIADLVANLKKYDGKTVKVTGKIMKVNPMIMGRNWLHLQDGSGKNLDLTVTTVEQLQVGATVTLEGVIALNKDFGAGYKYDYILEGAVVK